MKNMVSEGHDFTQINMVISMLVVSPKFASEDIEVGNMAVGSKYMRYLKLFI